MVFEKKRQSIRLKKYDYSQKGYYFVTVCTHEKQMLFGNIMSDRRGTISCALNNGGKIAKQCWKEIPNHYANVKLDEFIIMPNHVHGVLMIGGNVGDGGQGIGNGGQDVGKRAQDIEPLREDFFPREDVLRMNAFQHVVSGSVGAVVRGFKIGVTKWFRKNTDIHNVWQRNFYEHIVRDEGDLNRIQNYIKNNPLKWKTDEYYKN